MRDDRRVTVAVHTRSGVKLHVIDRPEMPPPARLEPATGEAAFKYYRRLLAWLALGLILLYAATSFGQVPSMQGIHDKLQGAKAAGKECEQVPWRARQAIVAAMAAQMGADEPATHHPAWEADMAPAVLADCGLLQLAQATTTYATQSEFDTLQAQVNSIQSSVGAIQAQLTTIEGQLSPAPQPPAPLPAAPKLVNSVAAAMYGGNATNALSATLDVTAGNLLVVACTAAGNGGPQAMSVGDAAGNTFVAAGSTVSTAVGPYGNPFAGLWYAKNAVGGTGDVVTCSYTLPANQGIVVLQYSGTDKAAPLDAMASGNGASGTLFSTAPFSTTSPNEVIIAAGMNAAGAGNPYVAGSGYTMEQQHYTYYAAEDQITSSTLNNATATMTEADTAPWAIVVATFKAGS